MVKNVTMCLKHSMYLRTYIFIFSLVIRSRYLCIRSDNTMLFLISTSECGVPSDLIFAHETQKRNVLLLQVTIEILYLDRISFVSDVCTLYITVLYIVQLLY